MGDIAVAEDFIVGIVEMMEEIGATHTLRLVEPGVFDPENPGAPVEDIITNIPVQAFVLTNDSFYIEGTSVVNEELSAIIPLDGITDEQVPFIRPGSFLIELTPEVDTHSILASSIGIIAGIYATAVVQLAG